MGTMDGRNPWTELPVAVADALRPELNAIAVDMVAAIRREVPGYRRPLNSEVGRDLVAAVRGAVHQFVELIENPEGPPEDDGALFRRLGKAEFLTGRGMDELQAAYRVGARVACRRYSEIVSGAGLPVATVALVSEAVLVHINALANQSVRGYAEARARSLGDLASRRRRLAERLLERNPGTSLESLAFQAEWPLPAAIACVIAEGAGPVGSLDATTLVLPRGGETYLLIPQPVPVDGLRRALGSRVAALGPAVPPRETWLSAYCARLALRGLPRTGELLLAEDHLGELILIGGEPIGRLLADRMAGVFAGLPTGKAARLEQTLQALLSSTYRTAPEVAAALGIHPQTARHRLRQLETLLGERLSDPAFRFEAELALRTRSLIAR
jgi:hypothetical protein